jgi:hypothetical protein
VLVQQLVLVRQREPMRQLLEQQQVQMHQRQEQQQERQQEQPQALQGQQLLLFYRKRPKRLQRSRRPKRGTCS